MDRAATSRTIAQRIQSVMQHSVSTRTIRRRFQQSGMSARRPLLRLPLTENNTRLRCQCTFCGNQHRISKCKSKYSCSVCGFRHNTLLHRQKGESSNAPLFYSASQLQGQELNPNAEEFHSSQENTVASLSCISNRSKTVILPTAEVWVLNHSTGSCIQARAVLDSGSMSNIATLDFANKLGAPQNRINIPIFSLGGNKTTVKSELNATIINGNSSFSTTLDFLVVSKITDFLPVSQINLNNLKIPQELADPNFGVPGKIDLLIGAEAFLDIIKEGIIRTHQTTHLYFAAQFSDTSQPEPHIRTNKINIVVSYQKCKT
ncbi:integrase catalytic domain-containing protein [Trichonephila clavipes]|nr:integrase catalytic domain-containing protein [Trichonephila clavipes]